MDDSARLELEKQLREQLEQEMEVRVKESSNKPAAPAETGEESDIERKLREDIEHELKAATGRHTIVPEPAASADDDLRKSLEAELQKELEGRIASSEATREPSKSTEAVAEDGPEVIVLPEEDKPIVAIAEDEANAASEKVKEDVEPKRIGKPADEAKADKKDPVGANSDKKPETKPAEDAKPHGKTESEGPKSEKPRDDVKADEKADKGDGAAETKSGTKKPKTKTDGTGKAGSLRKPTAQKKKRAGTSGPGRKKAGTKGKSEFNTKGPSATRSVSDQEKMIMAEKAKIDAKMRKQKMILYPAITIGTILLGVIVFKVASAIRGGDDPRERRVRVRNNNSSSSSTPRRSLAPQMKTITSVSELEEEVARQLADKKPQKAIDYIKKYQVDNPSETYDFNAKMDEIAEDYIRKKAGLVSWQALHHRVQLGYQSTDPADVRRSISALASYSLRQGDERFLGEYHVRKLKRRYADMTGGEEPR